MSVSACPQCGVSHQVFNRNLPRRCMACGYEWTPAQQPKGAMPTTDSERDDTAKPMLNGSRVDQLKADNARLRAALRTVRDVLTSGEAFDETRLAKTIDEALGESKA